MSTDELDPTELTCQILVEEVTNYLEQAMSPAERARFEAHLISCQPCNEYVEQIRQSIHLTGALRAEDLAESERQRLISLFRDWRRAHSH